jgi:tellurite resistance protein TerC
MPQSIGSPILWVGFTLLVLFLLALDLGVFHRKEHEISLKEALYWSLFWVGLSLLFNLGIFLHFGSVKGLEFLTGYVIEKALSVDNIFVFLVIFSFFNVPKIYHHKVLFWGILGALIMRALFIFAGTTLIQAFHWIIYIFGIFLVLTGFKILLQRKEEIDPERNPILRVFRKVVPIVPEYHGSRFLILEKGRRYATPLLLVLVVIEATDLVFAVDSIPAIFAVTLDPFIVYTSNIFAILGLRALYFLLAGVIDKFRYLKIGLGGVLIFVGIKMLISHFYVLPIGISLIIVTLLIGGSIFFSLMRPASTQTLSVTEEEGDKK